MTRCQPRGVRLRRMAIHRITIGSTLVTALTAVALATGCSGSPETTGSAPPTGTQGAVAAPAPEAVAWADGICSASTKLEASVQQVTAGLQIDPSASATALDQTKAQTRDRVTAVQHAANDLRTAAAAVPSQARDSVAAVQQQLAATADRARRAADQLAATAQQLADAQTTADTTAALAATATALAATSAGV